MSAEHSHTPATHPKAPATPLTVRDPVCGMRIDPAHAVAHAVHGGLTYSFCSTHCHDAFVREPGRYLRGVAAPQVVVSQVKRSLRMADQLLPPGKVRDPVCRMAVDPEHAVAQAQHAGVTYSFCCSHCRDAFAKNPASYLEGATAQMPAHL